MDLLNSIAVTPAVRTEEALARNKVVIERGELLCSRAKIWKAILFTSHWFLRMREKLLREGRESLYGVKEYLCLNISISCSTIFSTWNHAHLSCMLVSLYSFSSIFSHVVIEVLSLSCLSPSIATKKMQNDYLHQIKKNKRNYICNFPTSSQCKWRRSGDYLCFRIYLFWALD